MLGANEACIACHTRALKINTHRASLGVDVVIAENTSNRHYVENRNAKGSASYRVWENKDNKTLSSTVNFAT